MRAESLIVIPCYNEENRISRTLFVSLLNNLDSDILLVNDGSTDQTQEILSEIANTSSRFSVVNLPQNIGKSEAIRFGFAHAYSTGYKFVGTMDADAAVGSADMANALDLISDNNDLDVVIGARVMLAGSEVERKTSRRWIGRIIATWLSLSLKVVFYDPQSPCKIFRCSKLKESLDHPFKTRWFGEVELLTRMMTGNNSQQIRLKEFPILSWNDVDGSHFNLRSISNVVFDLIRVHFVIRDGLKTISSLEANAKGN